MKKIIILILIITTVQKTFGQRDFIEEIMSSSVLIQLSNGSNGTGFILTDSALNKVYLITAKHVLFQFQNKQVYLKDTSAELTIFREEPSITKEKHKVKINLEKCLISNNMKINNNHDVCAIYLGYAKDNLIFYAPYVSIFKQSMIIPVIPINTEIYDKVLVGNEIYIYGFPSSIGLENSPQIDYETPLIRKGIIAGKNNKQKTIIIDCPVYGGNSGGPVIEVINTINGRFYKVIGIVVEWIPYEEKWISNRTGLTNSSWYNSGYSVVVPMDFIYEIIK